VTGRLKAWHWVSAVTIPGPALIFLASACVTLLATRWVARNSADGPLTVTCVVDATAPVPDSSSREGLEPPGTWSPQTEQARTVEAILRERLASAGTEPRGIIPTAGGLQVAAEQPVVATSEDAYGLLTRLGFGAWRAATQRLGWRVSATLLRNDDTANPIGLAVVIQHVATGRHVFTQTVWAPSPQKAARAAAYEIAAWRFYRLAPPSSRSALNWRPTATSLGAYEEAAYCASRNRFDEAVYRATQGLAADPANHALRRVLGESYEWLGQFENALRTYASGIALIRDDHNGWAVSALATAGDPTSQAAPTTPDTTARQARRVKYPFWPQPDRSRSDAAEQSSRMWRFGDGLLWRYVVMLKFADQWVDRWIATLERREMQTRADSGHAAAKRWDGTHVDEHCPTLERLTEAHRRTRNAPQRDEEARMLRGFFRQRYRRLLAEEYPLLRTMWFGEFHERRDHFPAVDDGSPGPATDEHQATGIPAFLAAETERIPMRPGTGGVLDRIRARRGGPNSLTAWVEELEWLFAHVLDPHLPDSADWSTNELPRGEPPRTLAVTAVDAARRLGLGPADRLSDVAAALTDSTRWQRLRLSRRLIGAVASWATHHVLRLTRTTSPFDDRTRARLLALSEQLDLRAFLYRATLFELDRRPRHPTPRSLSPLSQTLQDLFWVTARFHYLQRLHRLAVTRPENAAFNDLRARTAAHARKITLQRSRFRLGWAAGDEWSVWYYAACVHAVVIPPAPTSEQVPDRDQWQRSLVRWIQDSDTYAEFAVRALNQAILVRGRHGLTLIEAGAQDWMLRRDPDLENLRMHPRFQRWVSATFCVAQPDAEDADAEVADKEPVADVIRREWNNDGVYGSEARWGRWSRRWWAANDLYFMERTSDFALAIAAQWRQLTAQDTGSHRPGSWDQRVAELMARDVEAWRYLAGYRLFAHDPLLRHEAMKRLALAAGQHTTRAPFPSRIVPLPATRMLNYFSFDQNLELLVSEAENASTALGSIPGTASQPWRPRPFVRPNAEHKKICDTAAIRWEKLASHLTGDPGLCQNGQCATLPDPAAHVR
jgi:tetratricopeptide (TPR) repeat protein